MSRRPLALGILLTLALDSWVAVARGSGLDQGDGAALAVPVVVTWLLLELMAWSEQSQAATLATLLRAVRRARGHIALSPAVPAPPGPLRRSGIAQPSLAGYLLRRQHAWQGIDVVYPIGVGDERPVPEPASTRGLVPLRLAAGMDQETRERTSRARLRASLAAMPAAAGCSPPPGRTARFAALRCSAWRR